jgi:SAM-dependent methyltransferase
MINPPLVPTELIQRFRSFPEWKAFVENHLYIFSANYAEKMIDEIRLSGIIDPLSQQVILPEQIVIGHDNYRETIKSNKLISRHRALLFELKHIASQGMEHLLSRQSKIYAPEALTDFALFLRGMFPRFLGSEFAETKAEKQAIYPISSEDLTTLTLNTGAFDLVISNDVFEHVPDLDQCLCEVVRILNHSGVLISTFPFVFNREAGIIKAKLKEGKMEYLTEPEYHGNPMQPDKGSLVFEVPGWDLVKRARAAGFEEAYFAFISSVKHGIVGKDINGVFVFVAIKKALSSEHSHLPLIANLNSNKRKFDTVAGLIGLPRSGTTVFAAAVGDHSNVKAVFEPWNSRKKNMPSTHLGVEQLIDLIKLERKEERVLFVKETATDLVYLDAIDFLLTDAQKIGSNTRLIWLFRDPMHAFLSEVQARKEWWGEADLDASIETFNKWAARSLNGLRKMIEICQSHPTLCVGYESFVVAPSETLEAVMAFLDLSFDEAQLDYFNTLDKNEVRGDNNVKENPQAISNESSNRRAAELKNIRKVISKSEYFKQIEALCKAGSTILGTKPPTEVLSKKFIGKTNEILSK